LRTGKASSFFVSLQRSRLSLIKDVVPTQLNLGARYFIVGGVLNGVSNGIINSILQLYLVGLGYGGQSLGTIFMMNALSSTVLTIPAGIMADRYGKRKMILIGLASVALSMVVFFLADSVELFALSFLLIGVSNATGTVLTPLYSSFFEGDDMDRAFGFYGLINLMAISFGSLGGFIPPYIVGATGVTLVEAYRLTMMAAATLFVLQNLFYYYSAVGVPETLSTDFSFILKSRRVVLKICGIGLLASVAGGLLFSLFPFYVNRKFGVESAALGTLFFAANLAMALCKGVASAVAKRVGGLRSITLGMALSAVFLMMMPFSPSFAVLTVLYILRSGTRFMSDPLLASLFMRSISENEKSTANSIRMISLNGGGIVAPVLGGAMMEQMGLDSPAYIGGALTLVSAALYSLLLREESQLLAKNT
jgi:MFS family permease